MFLQYRGHDFNRRGEGMFSFIMYSCIIILIQCTKLQVRMVMLFVCYVLMLWCLSVSVGEECQLQTGMAESMLNHILYSIH